MSTQYAVCHLQRGSGNDAGMSCHIERKTADGKLYVPENADKNRTSLNRELMSYPNGVRNRTEAIQHRIDNAGLHRKVGKNQTKAIRIILSGTHEQMMKIESQGKMKDWINANLKWLKETYGEDNLVSAVLHMDEKTPHIHATVVPIVQGARKRREREGEKKYRVNTGPRLSADDVMSRGRLRHYQNTYGAEMKSFGLERGVVGSTAKHVVNSDFYKQRMSELEADISEMEKELEAAKEGKSRFFALFNKGDLAKAKNSISEKDKEIALLKSKITELQKEKDMLCQQHRQDISKLHNGYKQEITKAIKELEKLKGTIESKDAQIARQNQQIDRLDRKANPHRYNLLSGAILTNLFVPNYLHPSLHIWTKVGEEEHEAIKYDIDYQTAKAHSNGDITDYEFVNAIFEPWEQVNEVQAQMLGAAFTLACGGPAQAHVGTGGGGTQSDMPWGEKDKRRKDGMRR